MRHRNILGGGKEDLQHIAQVIIVNMVCSGALQQLSEEEACCDLVNMLFVQAFQINQMILFYFLLCMRCTRCS